MIEISYSMHYVHWLMWFYFYFFCFPGPTFVFVEPLLPLSLSVSWLMPKDHNSTSYNITLNETASFTANANETNYVIRETSLLYGAFYVVHVRACENGRCSNETTNKSATCKVFFVISLFQQWVFCNIYCLEAKKLVGESQCMWIVICEWFSRFFLVLFKLKSRSLIKMSFLLRHTFVSYRNYSDICSSKKSMWNINIMHLQSILICKMPIYIVYS